MILLGGSNLLLRDSGSYSQNTLTQGQQGLDAALNSFSQTAADPASLAAMTVGSFAFRFARLGFLQGAASSGITRFAPRFLLNGAVNLSALGVEVTAFRQANNVFGSWAGHHPEQGVFNADGWRGTFVDFLALKTIGHLGAGQNIALTHFAQANAMVLGHEASARLGFTPHEEGSYIERLAHAEVTNMAMGAGMSLVQRFLPGLTRLERSLNLQQQTGSFPLTLARQKETSLSILAAQEGLERNLNGDTRKWLDQIVHPNFRRIRENGLEGFSRLDVPHDQRIGILTSGGDGPGENAVIESLVRGILQGYGSMGWEVMGIWEGFRGLLEPESRIFPLRISNVLGEAAIREVQARIHSVSRQPRHRGIAELGGNLLKSSRTNPLQKDPQAARVKETMAQFGIDALVVLGGNGSMGASRDLAAQGIPLVFIPQSIDNDVPGTDVSVGFPSAVSEGVKSVNRFYNTAHSCNRWFIVEVMGQHSGALALSIAREARADGVFVGEFPRPLSEIDEIIQRRRSEGLYHGIILVSEGAKFLDEEGEVIQIHKNTDPHGRLLIQSGQTASWLSEQIGRDKSRPESLAYLLRGAAPTASEISLARVLSQGAIHLLAAQQYGHLVGVRWNGEGWRRDYVSLQNLQGAQYLVGREKFLYVLEELGIMSN